MEINPVTIAAMTLQQLIDTRLQLTRDMARAFSKGRADRHHYRDLCNLKAQVAIEIEKRELRPYWPSLPTALNIVGASYRISSKGQVFITG